MTTQTRDNFEALYKRTHDSWIDLCAREKAGDPVTAERIRAGNKLVMVGLFLTAELREKQ